MEQWSSNRKGMIANNGEAEERVMDAFTRI